MARLAPYSIAHLRSLLLQARQSAWSITEYFAYPLMMFGATPFFLHLLGTEQYGRWMLLLTFGGFGGLVGLGMGTAAIKEVSAFRGRGDLNGAANAVRNCLAVTLASSLALSALFLIIGLLAAPNLLTRMGEPAQVRVIVVAACMLLALEQIDTVFTGAIRGLERFDISARIEATAKLILVGSSLAAAWWTRDLCTVLWTTITITVLRALAKCAIATKLLHTGALWPRWQSDHIARVFAFGKWTWAQSIGAAMFATADRLIVGSLMGADALARYSVCLQLAQQVHTVPAAAAQVLFPMISRRNAQRREVLPLVKRAMLWSILLAALLALPMVAFRHAILTIWVGSAIADQSSGVLGLLAIGFALLAINNVPHFVLLGFDDARLVAWCNIGAGIFALLIGLWFIPLVGLIGAAWARLGYAAAICLLIVPMINRLKQAK